MSQSRITKRAIKLLATNACPAVETRRSLNAYVAKTQVENKALKMANENLTIENNAFKVVVTSLEAVVKDLKDAQVAVVAAAQSELKQLREELAVQEADFKRRMGATVAEVNATVTTLAQNNV